MRKSVLICTAMIMVLSHSISRADFDDLPDPGGDGGSPSQPSQPTPQPGGGSQQQYAGSLTINGLSRKTGGTVYKVKLQKALPLARLDLRVVASRVKIYEASVYTENGQRVDINQFRNTDVLEAGSLLGSESLNTLEKISTIEFSAESYTAEADILLTAVSTSEVPKLSLVVEVPPPPVPAPSPTPSPTPGPWPGDGDGTTPGGQFQVKDRVLYNNQSVGTVTLVLPGDKVRVQLDDGQRLDLDNFFLEKSTDCVDGFCEGRNVLYNGFPARIINIFASGWVYISTQHGTKEVVDLFFLSDSSECDSKNKFCIGDAILYQQLYEGTVTKIYPDGTIGVRLMNGSSQNARANQLAKSLRCTENVAVSVCVGDRVRVQSMGATVLGLYSNGRAKVQIDRQNRPVFVDQNSLAKPLRCVKSICVGQKVSYGNQRATVKEIYSNNTARVTIGLLGKEYLVRFDSLRP